MYVHQCVAVDMRAGWMTGAEAYGDECDGWLWRRCGCCIAALVRRGRFRQPWWRRRVLLARLSAEIALAPVCAGLPPQRA